ncbi:MAG: hypothetical protein F4Y88_05740 [Chloroflexi bacterium]|nr:hypothetical protein [Chloroflexota bacterium]
MAEPKDLVEELIELTASDKLSWHGNENRWKTRTGDCVFFVYPSGGMAASYLFDGSPLEIRIDREEELLSQLIDLLLRKFSVARLPSEEERLQHMLESVKSQGSSRGS